ncbi:MAG TPA: NAD(P)H-hydrate dehydratase [Terriglobales bacterium]|nr:NAD(P)H-hydrate dehydratase [Terriglobales bacterium]
MKIVTSAEMREIDRATNANFGVPSITLMENAGEAVAVFVTSRFPSVHSIGVICGKGNNGGDGFVVARKLHDAGKDVHVLLLADPSELKGDAAEMYKQLPSAVVVRSPAELDKNPARSVFECKLLVDAILGTGFKPPVTGLYEHAIAKMNASSSLLVAVDIPSGADADAIMQPGGTVLSANAVVTFTAPRPAHVFSELTRGPVLVAPIGSPPQAIASKEKLNLISAGDVASLIGPRTSAANKGSFGHVLVIGGSVGKAGSVAMAGMAALRAGAGLSTVATPKSVLPTVAGFHPEVMTEALEETEIGSISKRALSYGHVDAIVQGKTVLAVGPGISRHKETVDFVRTTVKKFTTPMVLDADGLNAFEGHTDELNGKDRTLVITPHPGEMARLIGASAADVQKDRINIARKFAADHQLIVVLKGNRTLVAAPDGDIWVNVTGNPGMATGGTGDILTGMTAGLMAQNPKNIFEAVLCAVYLHGLAGDVARESMGEHSLTATDLLRVLPEAFRRARKAAEGSSVEWQG